MIQPATNISNERPVMTFSESLKYTAKKAIEPFTTSECTDVALYQDPVLLSKIKPQPSFTPIYPVSMPVKSGNNPALTIAHSLAQSAKPAAAPLELPKPSLLASAANKVLSLITQPINSTTPECTDVATIPLETKHLLWTKPVSIASLAKQDKQIQPLNIAQDLARAAEASLLREASTRFASTPVRSGSNPALTVAHTLAQSAKAAAAPLELPKPNLSAPTVLNTSPTTQAVHANTMHTIKPLSNTNGAASPSATETSGFWSLYTSISDTVLHLFASNSAQTHSAVKPSPSVFNTSSVALPSSTSALGMCPASTPSASIRLLKQSPLAPPALNTSSAALPSSTSALDMCPASAPSAQDTCSVPTPSASISLPKQSPLAPPALNTSSAALPSSTPALGMCPARNIVEETVTAASSSYLPAVAGATLLTLAVASAAIYYFKYYKTAPSKKPTASEQISSTWNRFLIRVGVRNAPKIEKFFFGLFQKPEWNIAWPA